MTSEVHVAGIPKGSPERILARGIEDVFSKTTGLPGWARWELQGRLFKM